MAKFFAGAGCSAAADKVEGEGVESQILVFWTWPDEDSMSVSQDATVRRRFYVWTKEYVASTRTKARSMLEIMSCPHYALIPALR